MQRFDRKFFADAWRLTTPYWRSREKWPAYGLLTLVIGLNLGLVYISVLITEWYNVFYDALQHHNAAHFWSAMLRFGWLAFAYIAASVYQTYLAEMLYIRWRRWLTEHYLEHWLGGRTYYRMQLLNDGTDNPDQRISEDIGAFISGVRHLSLGLLRSVVTLGSFIAMLWVLSARAVLPFHGHLVAIPGYLVWAALIYSVGGTWLTVRLGRSLIDLNFNQQRYDADFRFGLVRVRENSESIALYSGEARERESLSGRFASVFSNYWQIMRRQKILNWFSTSYTQIAIIFPFLVTAPSYFAHSIQIGLMMQIASAFGQVQGALSYVVSSFDMLAVWHAVVDRLSGFHGHMDQAHSAGIEDQAPRREAGTPLAVTALTLNLPDGRALLQGLSLTVPNGASLLLTGPSGSGKSTLMRALAGVWPFGSGRITAPPVAESLFLPQKPYLPLGTLREILLYPNGDPTTPDEALADHLHDVGLEALAGALSEQRPWAMVLSVGEQQRLAFARLLIQRPSWIFLDEATSALDEAAEAALYRLLRERLPESTMVSVGHRSTLNAFHASRMVLSAGTLFPTPLPG